MIRLFVLSAFLAFASAVHAQPAKSVPELAGLDRLCADLRGRIHQCFEGFLLAVREQEGAVVARQIDGPLEGD